MTTPGLFSGTRAVGVEYVQQGQTKQAYADQEVILCGGTINSPQILLCSGIGPATQLRQFNLHVAEGLAIADEKFHAIAMRLASNYDVLRFNKLPSREH